MVLLNLAISDLVIGTGFMFGNLISLIKMHPHNKTVVFILRFLISCLMHEAAALSVANLQMVAILKLYVVNRPLKYRTIKKRFLIRICTVQWVLITLLVVLDYTFSYDSYIGHSIFFQKIIPPLIFLATIVLAITYFLIFKSIRTRMVVGKSHNLNQNKQRKQAFKACFYRVIAFNIFWLPYAGWKIYLTVEHYENYTQIIGIVFQYLALLNSVMNQLSILSYFEDKRKTQFRVVRQKKESFMLHGESQSNLYSCITVLYIARITVLVTGAI